LRTVAIAEEGALLGLANGLGMGGLSVGNVNTSTDEVSDRKPGGDHAGGVLQGIISGKLKEVKSISFAMEIFWASRVSLLSG
jgi:hypothetical protein